MRIAPTAALIWIAAIARAPIAARATTTRPSRATAVVAHCDLDGNTIRRVFRRHQNEIKNCYELELQKDHALRGRLVVKVTIDGKGRASAAEISESEIANEALQACITGTVRGWEFPIVGNHTIYTVFYPYVFEPAPKPAPGETKQ